MLNSFLMNYIKITENRIVTVKCQVWYAASTGISKKLVQADAVMLIASPLVWHIISLECSYVMKFIAKLVPKVDSIT